LVIEAPLLLEVRGLHVHYGGIHAVKGLDLTVKTGEVVCLIGANGAGKTSTLKALMRMIPAQGAVLYAGRSIADVSPQSLIVQGLALVPEGRGVFARLSVEENLLLGAHWRRDDSIHDDLDRQYSDLPRLKERRHQLAGTLSGGEQQMLAMARALMGRPKLLLLDEPSMGLAPIMVAKVFELIRRIAAQGVTVVLVEQNARLALSVCSRGYVMASGIVTLHDQAFALLANEHVQRAYLGG
jgi:branched-chain amino acid transport system ATP-binding protein